MTHVDSRAEILTTAPVSIPRGPNFCVACGGLRHLDAATRDLSVRSVFIRAKKLERQYAVRLRSLARAVDHIVRGFDYIRNFGIATRGADAALRSYEATLEPWARAVADRMVAEVAAHDSRSWRKASESLGESVKRTIETTPVGALYSQRVEAQVGLIKSLPRDAAERVRKLATQASFTGERTKALVEDIYKTGEVTRARADLIARTETARTSTEFTKVRAEAAGSTHFKWMTVGDNHVRKTHKQLAGTVHRWDTPPECDPGEHALPGCIWNCRCYAEPIF